MSSVSYKVGKIRDIYWLTVHRKSSTCALFFSTSFSISLSFCSWMLMQNSHFLTHFPMNSTIFFQFMRTGTSFPSRFMEKPEKHLCVFLFVFQILSDVVVFRLFSGPNGAKLITLNHKREQDSTKCIICLRNTMLEILFYLQLTNWHLKA